MKITPLENTPVNRAIFALNYYISTGDHIGEGVAVEQGNHTVLMVCHDPAVWEDKDNWERLRARLQELEKESLIVGVRDFGAAGQFHQYGIIVETARLDEFEQAVKAQPGPLGWGSLYTFLERHGLIENKGGDA